MKDRIHRIIERGEYQEVCLKIKTEEVQIIGES